jgi:hypothetical protein
MQQDEPVFVALVLASGVGRIDLVTLSRWEQASATATSLAIPRSGRIWANP